MFRVSLGVGNDYLVENRVSEVVFLFGIFETIKIEFVIKHILNIIRSFTPVPASSTSV